MAVTEGQMLRIDRASLGSPTSCVKRGRTIASSGWLPTGAPFQVRGATGAVEAGEGLSRGIGLGFDLLGHVADVALELIVEDLHLSIVDHLLE